jgi:Planctomycete cytochrome C
MIELSEPNSIIAGHLPKSYPKSMRNSLLSLTLLGMLSPFVGTQAQDKIDFYKQVYPFVKSGCVKCHAPEYTDENGRTKRPKADLVVTSPEAFMKGGESGPVLVPGKPEESEFLRRTLLPLEDDDHQPAEGKAPQWTDAEKELFAKWITEGANFGEWKGDDKPQEGIEWDGKEKAAGTIQTW